MVKTKKYRLLSVLIITMLIFTGIISAHAVEEDDPAYERALALRNAGILYGMPDGTFGLDQGLKRSEAVAILLRALNVYDEAKETAYSPIFTDVPEKHWASRFILYAYNKDMARGVSATEFAPNRYVTANEFCTLLLRYMLNDPKITTDNVFEYIMSQTPLDMNFIRGCFSKDQFLRSDMVHIVYEMCLGNPADYGEANIENEPDNPDEIQSEYGKKIIGKKLNLLEAGDIFYIDINDVLPDLLGNGTNISARSLWDVEISDNRTVSALDLEEGPRSDLSSKPIAADQDTGIFQFNALTLGSAVITISYQNAHNVSFEYKVAVVNLSEPAIILDPEMDNRVLVGSLVNIVLDSNATTGYSWIPEANEYVELISNNYSVSEPDALLPGAGGGQTLTFYTCMRGKTMIELGYARPFEENTAPIQTLQIKVIIE